MIIDKIENCAHYHFGPVWKSAFEFLNTLTLESEDKRYNIDGDNIFALVMSYKTFSPENALFESHRDYVDIQTVITECEGFECAFTDELTTQKPYEKASDIEFYKRETPGHTRVNIYPGTFIMLFPHDAHMPGLIIDEEKIVKKVVVKIKKELLEINNN